MADGGFERPYGLPAWTKEEDQIFASGNAESIMDLLSRKWLDGEITPRHLNDVYRTTVGRSSLQMDYSQCRTVEAVSAQILQDIQASRLLRISGLLTDFDEFFKPASDKDRELLKAFLPFRDSDAVPPSSWTAKADSRIRGNTQEDRYRRRFEQWARRSDTRRPLLADPPKLSEHTIAAEPSGRLDSQRPVTMDAIRDAKEYARDLETYLVYSSAAELCNNLRVQTYDERLSILEAVKAQHVSRRGASLD